MKGSGVDNFEFEFGTFTCECGHENEDALAYGDDWGNWEVVCEKCAETHTTGSTNSEPEDKDWDNNPDK